jgi:hypothetical protein
MERNRNEHEIKAHIGGDVLRLLFGIVVFALCIANGMVI